MLFYLLYKHSRFILHICHKFVSLYILTFCKVAVFWGRMVLVDFLYAKKRGDGGLL